MVTAEVIRKRPGMYFGDTQDGSALLRMLWELLANALDEHLAGRCSTITVELPADGSIAVEDDGRGIALFSSDGLPFAERALTSFHDTPTFDGHAPHEHVGAQGLGLFPVCVLSSRLELHVWRDGRAYSQDFSQGIATSPLRDLGPTEKKGTRLSFLPDPAIFKPHSLDVNAVSARLHELSFLLPALTLGIKAQSERIFREPRGLLALIDSKAVGPELKLPTFTVSGVHGQISVEAAARWSAGHESSLESFANIVPTHDGGEHVQGFLAGLLAGLKQAAPDMSSRRSARSLARGLNAVVCVRLMDPTYGSPTKSLLLTPEAGLAARSVVAESFAAFLEREPAVLRHLQTLLQRPTSAEKQNVGQG